MKHPKCQGTTQDDCGYQPSITCAQCQFGGGTRDPRAACNSRDPLKGLSSRQRAALADATKAPTPANWHARRTWASLVRAGLVKQEAGGFVREVR